jgi:carboxypeptidase T
MRQACYLFLCALTCAAGLNSFAQAKTTHSHNPLEPEKFSASIAVENKDQISELEEIGIAVTEKRKGEISTIATSDLLQKIEEAGFHIKSKFSLAHHTLDFPLKDSDYHNFDELTLDLKKVATQYPNVAKLLTIGESIEGRPLYMMKLSGSALALNKANPSLPSILFTGMHHAREHLSVELPLAMIERLAEGYQKDPKIRKLLNTRVVYIVPMLNPDGQVYDLAGKRYRWWRKNRRNNGDGTFGVDLNRNYGYKWGTVGASPNSGAETYHGPSAFSEPETQAIRNFVESQDQLNMVISFHTFSELILYPWGHTNRRVRDSKDREIFVTMAETMADMNGYKPMQSSGLYKTSGDTCDWAYGVHGIICFTFELYPGSRWDGGFYPGDEIIPSVIENNWDPVLYAISYVDDPYRAVEDHTEKPAPGLPWDSAKALRDLSSIFLK